MIAVLTREARGQVLDLPDATTNPTAPPRDVDQKLPYWERGEIRPFTSAVFDVGGFFVRPELNVGYGQPHFNWIGAEIFSKLTLGGVTLGAGVHGQIPNVDARLGVRSFRSADQRLLQRKNVYRESDPTILDQPASAYDSVDADLAVNVRALGGSVSLETRALALFQVPDGYDVFEDVFRVVVRPPLVWQAKLTYVVFAGWDDRLALGFTTELLGAPARDNLVFRVGPVLTVALTEHLQAIGGGAFAILYHDDLGLSGSDLGQIGLRYRWASGEPYPDFP
ncbi:MAG: hypothetical protein U0414_27345 [Polyangiaceae bacterium]